jgi:hypothetical protein
LVIALTCGLIAGSVADAWSGPAIVVTDDAGRVLARLALDESQAFSLSYRNSLYGSLAEERFVIEDGRFRLDYLAAQELAVLEEYYAVTEAPVLATDGWSAPPAYELELERLTVAATDLGERTLLVEGQAAVPLWELTADSNPFVHLEIEQTR